MSYPWPDKQTADFTDEELADAIETQEGDPDPVTRSLVESCTREWESRRSLSC